MTIYYNYEAETKLHIPWMNIIGDVIDQTLNFMKYKKQAEVSVTIVDNKQIRRINREFRQIDRATDVLSFPMGDINPESGEVVLGDIVLSAEKIISQAKEYGHTRKRELAFLTCHSMLHLLGYDHLEENEREEMEALQKSILEKAGYQR